MNFVGFGILWLSVRKSGRVFLNAMAVTSSEGASPRRMVRIQEPKERQIRRCGGENLKQSLGDESELDVAVIGIEFAPDAITVVSRFSMGILVAAFSFDGRHGRHPEVICESSDNTQGLLEGQFDFEAQAIQFDDLQRRQIQICGQQKNRTA
jgi:hypothetical protein